MREVRYTGEWPNTCRGELEVLRDADLIYKTASYSFSSTGGIWFSENGDCGTNEGSLIWNDYSDEKQKFIEWAKTQPEALEIIGLAEDVISNVSVCCGGCI